MVRTGNNTLNGGDGDDILQDGSGIDIFTGGLGSDHFILGTNSNLHYNIEDRNDYALITDFNLAEDVIQLTNNSSQYLLDIVNGSSELYLDSNGDNFLDSDDKLLAVIQDTNNLDWIQNYFDFV